MGPYVISSSRERLAASAQSLTWKPLQSSIPCTCISARKTRDRCCVYPSFRGNRTICRRFVNAAIAGFSLFLLLHRDDNGIFILSFFDLFPSFPPSLSTYFSLSFVFSVESREESPSGRFHATTGNHEEEA